MKNIFKIINLREMFSYLVVGMLTTVVSLGSYYLLTLYLLNPVVPLELQLANVFSWIFAVTFAYFTNRIFVFKSNNDNMLIEGIKFYVARLLTLVIDMTIMFLFVSLMGINDRVIKIISQVVVVITNYIISKFVVFKKTK